MNRKLNSSLGKPELNRTISIDKKIANQRFQIYNPGTLENNVNTLRNMNDNTKKLCKIIGKLLLESKQKGFQKIKAARINNQKKQKQLKILTRIFTNKLYNLKYHAFAGLILNQSKKVLKERTSLRNKIIDLQFNAKQLQTHKNKLIQFNTLADKYMLGTTEINQINSWFKTSADIISPETKRLKSLIVKMNDYRTEFSKQKKRKEQLETNVNELSLKIMKTSNTKNIQQNGKNAELNQIIQLLELQKINQLKLEVDKNKFPLYKKLIEKIYEIWKRIPSPIEQKYLKTITDKINEVFKDDEIQWAALQKYVKVTAPTKSKLQNSENQLIQKIFMIFKIEDLFYNYCKSKTNEASSKKDIIQKQTEQLKISLQKQKKNSMQKTQENVKLQNQIKKLSEKHSKLEQQFQEYKQNQRIKYQSQYSRSKNNKSNSTRSLNHLDSHDEELEQLIKTVNKPSCTECQHKEQQINRMLFQLDEKEEILHSANQNFNKQLTKLTAEIATFRNNSNQNHQSLNSFVEENTQLNIALKKTQNDLNHCYRELNQLFNINKSQTDQNYNFQQLLKLIKKTQQDKKMQQQSEIKKLKKQIELFKGMIEKKLIDDKTISQDEKLVEYRNNLNKLKDILKIKDKIIEELRKTQKDVSKEQIEYSPASNEANKDFTHFDLEYNIHQLRVQNTHLSQTISKLLKDKNINQDKLNRLTNENRYLNKQKEFYIKQIKKKQIELKKSLNIIENLTIINKNSNVNNMERKTSNRTFANQLQFQSTKTEYFTTNNFNKLYEKLIYLLPVSYPNTNTQFNQLFPITIIFYQILKLLAFNEKLQNIHQSTEQSIELYMLYAQSNKVNNCFDLLLKFIKASYTELTKIKNEIIVLNEKSECQQFIKFLKTALVKSVGEDNLQKLLKKYLSNQSQENSNQIQPFAST